MIPYLLLPYYLSHRDEKIVSTCGEHCLNAMRFLYQRDENGNDGDLF